ncbi:hypothetical protein CO051_03595 [Candidatus Roizmanbacteria bacterium CG_4_9_14_0_2_um_filter_39_13]|uniref:Phosphomannomutase/phosphoglucomutase n=2 Tax=Candidatus Roizmaniibacteriota TaxID=1752723 RepID=A0A2M8EZ21_9BACT|nr:MAG: hypothetical protein COY15_01255 [Candidatus Roizmanbacteria bacterium CG_4_10_14_0_2_um_filter_39_12]PJC31979.1 MAG: hypothetical protein CO051_03595 [Candidatus Roizmanbacteria bacterium CG_4_9_14_0_2_um_filter_39_13]PJE61928.1 MAG: hypothetical protein COU87_02015 [Candidatus Roizmanbacteria bacterium CG10_big_fil_rev_8_21_14_0_10_39_12]
MAIDTSIFKTYDIRGIYPKQLNEDVMEDITRAIYTFFQRKLNKTDMTIVLGHDMRISSPALHAIAAKTFRKCGAQVIDIGLVATPSMYFAVKNDSYDTGIQISASHNPKEYNGIKIVVRNGDSIIKVGKNAGMNTIISIIENETYADYVDGGTITKQEDVLKEELDQALEAVHPGDVSGLKVVIDPANAMGILPFGELFEQIEATLVKMNFELDGTFPAHQADPLQHKTLVDLQKKVVEEHADMGIAIDGDADRAMFIDEKGQIIPATLITTLIVGEMLKENPGERILADIRYIRNVEDMVKKMGGEVGYTKIGHALITEQVNTEHALFAGESSGHYYFRSMGGCESTIRVVLYVLRVVAREKRPFSEIMEEMRTSVESGEFNYLIPETLKIEDVVSELKTSFSDGELSELDGIAISYPEWRFSVRTSNTEPLMRLNVEGKSEEVVHENTVKIQKMLMDRGAILHE